MRSLSRIIRSGQYAPIVSDYCPGELTPTPVEQAVSPPKDDTTEESSAPRRGEREEEQVRQMLERAFLKAKQIVDSAQAYSAQKVQEARDTIAGESAEAKRRGYSDGYAQGTETGRKEGSEAGHRAGLEEGKKQAEAENRKSLDELSLMIEAVEKSKTQILRKFENDLLDLATAMAQAILKQEIRTDDKAVRNIILSAMEEYRNQEWVRIYVPEKTASVLLKADNSIVDALKDISDSVKVIASPGMADGACILETPDQVIDAGIDSQLTKIRRAISEAMRNKPDGAT